jgi:hypothetical protein
MAKRRTNGWFVGEFREGDGDPEEINAPVAIEADPVAGIVRTNIRGNEEEIRSHRAAMSMAYFQEQLRRDRQRTAYANRRVTPLPKPKGAVAKRLPIPPGYVVCPACSSGETDVWDCARCDGRGIVRASQHS